MADKLKLAWAAGFFDGEGCIYSDKPHINQLGTLRLSIGQVDPEPLFIFQELFGGSVIKEKSRNVYRWRAYTHENIKAILIKLQPFLVVKKEECDYVLRNISYYKPIIRGKAGGNKALFKKRTVIYNKLRELKDVKYERRSRN